MLVFIRTSNCSFTPEQSLLQIYNKKNIYRMPKCFPVVHKMLTKPLISL